MMHQPPAPQLLGYLARFIRRSRAGACMLLLAGLLAACSSTRGGPVPYDVKLGNPDVPEPPRLETYRLQPMDALSISVFQVADLSGEYEVDLGGNIALPLVGTMQVANLTSEELRLQLRDRLRKFVKDPVISIGVKPSTKRTITVDGSVKSPGMYPVNGPVTLIQAVALAGGLDQDANPRRVAVFRRVGGQRMAAAFDLETIRRAQAEDPEVLSGDIVVVESEKNKELQRTLLSTIPLIGIFRPY